MYNVYFVNITNYFGNIRHPDESAALCVDLRSVAGFSAHLIKGGLSDYVSGAMVTVAMRGGGTLECRFNVNPPRASEANFGKCVDAFKEDWLSAQRSRKTT